MNVEFASILEVGRLLRAGEVSSEALTTLMLERIDAYNDRLNAFYMDLPNCQLLSCAKS